LQIFLPGFALVPLLDRIVRLTERRAWAQGFIDGANAAALGLIAAVTTPILQTHLSQIGVAAQV
jgi:chromate transport protein ChrA